MVPSDPEVSLTASLSAKLRRGGRLGPLTPLARSVRNAERQATSRWRRLPDFLIIGAQKSGTTSLYYYLCRHPEVAPAIAKGVHYFEDQYAKGLHWYRSRFPLRVRDRITGEASPEYLFHPLVPERVTRDLPDVKLIALLRNPVERAYSHYQHERAKGVENLSLAAALSAEGDRLRGEMERVRADDGYISFPLLHYSYRSRGLYAEQIERWLKVAPKDRLLILQAERLFSDPAAIVEQTLSFLGLPKHASGDYPVQNERRYEPINASVQAELSRFYREPNEALYELIGCRFDWH